MTKKNARNVFKSIKSLANSYTSAAHQAGQPLPYLTIEDFGALGDGLRIIATASTIAYSPVLQTEAELLEWNAYSSNHSFWIAQGREQESIMGYGEDGEDDGNPYEKRTLAEVVQGSNSSGLRMGNASGDYAGNTTSGVHAGNTSGTVQLNATKRTSDLVGTSNLSSQADSHAGASADKDSVEGGAIQSHSPNHQLDGANISDHVFRMDRSGNAIPVAGSGLFAPLWQMTPVPDDTSMVNFNLASNSLFSELLDQVLLNRKEALSKLLDASALFGQSSSVHEVAGPASILLQPVFEELGAHVEARIVGVVSAVIPWKDFFDDVSPIQRLQFASACHLICSRASPP
jgi:hypothetical protein